ncbi:uncharacterized protein LOC141866194 isoform X1 [Acropora palmata]|uniref:uncharacterized protein LOC141866194 isoform X1 n=1 Tax=Acropora palmata TaxID=6131 RepID=UPI003DA0D76C
MSFGSSHSVSDHGGDESFQRLSVKQISPSDVQRNVRTIKKAFKSFHLNQNTCLNPQHDAESFNHFEQGVRLGEIYTDISRKFVERSKIVLKRECLVRLQAFSEFVTELEESVENYTSLLLNDRKLSVETFPFKVERFHDICQKAKTHCSHEMAIRKMVSEDVWICKSLSDMQDDLNMFHKTLHRQREMSFSLISSILWCVLRIVKKWDWRLSPQALSALCQGIEDYNRLIEFVKSFEKENGLPGFSEARQCSKLSLDAFLSPAVSMWSDVCLLPLSKLTNSIASVRSKVLTCHVCKFLSEHEEVTRAVRYDFVTNFEWNDFGVALYGGGTRSENAMKKGILTVLNRNQVPLLKLDPDSQLPLFYSQEQAFLSNLTSQLTKSTSLIMGHQLIGERKTVILPSIENLKDNATAMEETGHDQKGMNSPVSHSEGHGILKHSTGYGSPRLNKRVQWNAPLDAETMKQIQTQYDGILWSSFGRELINALSEYPEFSNKLKDYSFGPLFLWSDFFTMVNVRMLESLRLSGCLPVGGNISLHVVSCYLHCFASASSWDSAFCRLLGTSQTDKCRLNDNVKDGVPGTQTVRSMIALFDPLSSIFEMTSYWKQPLSQSEGHACKIVRSTAVTLPQSFCRLRALLSFSLNWFDTKLLHFLASWSLQQYLLITQWDLLIFLESVKKTFNLVQLLCVVHEDSSSWNSISLHYQQVQELVSKLEGLVKKSWALFSKDLTKMSSEFFQEAMPTGKNWKKSRQSGTPYQRNFYVEHAVCQILEPVVESTQRLPTESRLNVLTVAVNTMMEAWSNWILKQEIIFSFNGAHQLSLDFGYIKIWLASDSSNLSSEMQSHLLNLDVFRHLEGAVRLLMLQPRKKRPSPSDNDDTELESNISTMSSSSVLSSFSGVDIDGYDLDVLNDKSIPNSQKWLDLRLRGGKSKKGLLPFCLKVGLCGRTLQGRIRRTSKDKPRANCSCVN